MDTGLTLTCHMADSPYGSYCINICRDIAPLRLVSWVSCEVRARVQQVLNQLMILFGAVTPGSSNEVLEIGLQQLGVTASRELSWDMIRDALIRGVTIEEVCRLMVSFLQRLLALSFVSRGFTKSWVGQVALRSPINRHALDLTVALDD